MCSQVSTHNTSSNNPTRSISSLSNRMDSLSSRMGSHNISNPTGSRSSHMDSLTGNPNSPTDHLTHTDSIRRHR